MSSVYIFGAGASRHIGYPLASNMGAEWLDWMLHLPEGPMPAAARILIEEFGKPRNVEDFITELESRIRSLKTNSPSDKIERQRLGNCRGQLFVALREWFRAIHLNPAPAYVSFADIVRKDDVVLTFNYDDSLEKELRKMGHWDVSHGYGFRLSSSDQISNVLLLKLHGSINWLASLFGGKTSGAIVADHPLGHQPVIHQADLEYLGYKNFTGRTYPGGGAFPSLILPGRNKEFFYDTSLGAEFVEFWNSLWLQAEHALKQAGELFVCGYSLLKVDERACSLIFNSPRRDIPVTVVCGDQSDRIANDFRSARFENVTSRQNVYFEDWIKTKI